MNVRSDPTSQIAAYNGSPPLRFSRNGFKNGCEFAEFTVKLESKEATIESPGFFRECFVQHLGCFLKLVVLLAEAFSLSFGVW